MDRKKKYDIGYTAGVFDMFHLGHLNLLKNAKSMCNKLIVGVSIDECVAHKNKLPIISLDDRIAILQACRYVDGVVVQSDLDKYKAWEWLQYDVLFSGDDWKGVPRWNMYEAALRKVSVDVIYFPYTKGISSSILKDRLS